MREPNRETEQFTLFVVMLLALVLLAVLAGAIYMEIFSAAPPAC